MPEAWEHANAEEYGRGAEIITEHRVMHNVHGDIQGSILELRAGSGDTGMARTVGGGVRGSHRGDRPRDCREEAEIV